METRRNIFENPLRDISQDLLRANQDMMSKIIRFFCIYFRQFKSGLKIASIASCGANSVF